MARHPACQNYEKRKASFTSDFPIKGITSTEFADAGFYSIGIQDYTRCFYCGVGLRGWDDTDDPWKQHAKFSSLCNYLIEKKGENFVKLQGANTERVDNAEIPLSNLYSNSLLNVGDDSSQSKRVLTSDSIELHMQAGMDHPTSKLVLKAEGNISLVLERSKDNYECMKENAEKRIYVKAIMDTKEVRTLLKYSEKLNLNEDDIESALKNRAEKGEFDYKDLADLVDIVDEYKKNKK